MFFKSILVAFVLAASTVDALPQERIYEAKVGFGVNSDAAIEASLEMIKAGTAIGDIRIAYVKAANGRPMVVAIEYRDGMLSSAQLEQMKGATPVAIWSLAQFGKKFPNS